jgi:hypothetical protein
MKNICFFVLSILFSANAFADEAGYQQLLNAITICPSAQNPSLGLAQLLGNSYSNVNLVGPKTVTAEILYDPTLINPLSMQPTRLMGNIRIEMSYPAPGYGLVCKLTVN